MAERSSKQFGISSPEYCGNAQSIAEVKQAVDKELPMLWVRACSQEMAQT